MNRFSSIILALSFGTVLAQTEPAFRVPTAEEMKIYLTKRPELDLIRWKDETRGAPLQVRILEAGPREITLQKTVQGAVIKRNIPLSELAGISIQLSKVEEQLLQNPTVESVPALRVLWDARMNLCDQPGGHVPETGMALAKALRLSDPVGFHEEAKAVLDLIRVKSNEPVMQAQARGEFQTLEFARSMVEGPAEKTDELAWAITESEDLPEAMLMATSWLADRHFADLQELERNHPRWDEDDEVKPIRERLYHLSLDFAIYPSLFHPLHAEQASSGLLKAWKVYRYTRQNELALYALQDIAALYPGSTAAMESAAELARLEAAQKTGKPVVAETEPTQDEENPDADASLPAVPPKPKRYNLFQD